MPDFRPLLKENSGIHDGSKWDGHRFQIPPHPRRFTFAGAKVQLYQNLEGKIAIYYGNTRLNHTAV